MIYWYINILPCNRPLIDPSKRSERRVKEFFDIERDQCSHYTSIRFEVTRRAVRLEYLKTQFKSNLHFSSTNA